MLILVQNFVFYKLNSFFLITENLIIQKKILSLEKKNVLFT